MSDPNAPNDPIGDAAADPVDRAYAEAEAMLRDDAERAARRARVLAAVAAAQTEPRADVAPAATPVTSALPPPRRMSRNPAPWLMAAGVAGVATLVGLRVAPPDMWRPPQIERAPPTPKTGLVREATPPPPTAMPAAPTDPSTAKAAPPPPAPPRATAAAPVADVALPPPLAIPPVQRRAETAEPGPPPPLPIPPVASRVEAPAPPPPPLPIPPVARHLEAPAPAASMAIGPAVGEIQRPPPMLITNPDWARRPSGEDIAQYYPERAQRTETNGSATISCTVAANGTLFNCSVVSEAPADYGFGEAALRMFRIYRMRPRTAEGAPIEGRTVRARIEFKVPN